MKIDRREERVAWSLPCYDTIRPAQRSDKPSRLFQVDVNLDGTTDLVTGNTKNGSVAIQAINGLDGSVIWSTKLACQGNEAGWPYATHWPMMQIVGSGDRDYLVFVDADPKDDRKMQIKCLHLETGVVTSHLSYDRLQDLSSVQRDGIALSVLAPQRRDGVIGFKVEPRNAKFCDWYVAQVDQQGVIHQKHRFDTSHSTLITADVDGDGTLERVDIQNAKVKVHCGDSDQLLGEFELPKDMWRHFLQSVGKKTYLAGYTKDEEHVWFELPSGKVKLRDRGGFQPVTLPGEIQLPQLLELPHQTMLIGSTPEAAICRPVHLGAVNTAEQTTPVFPVVMRSTASDQRYQLPVTAMGIYGRLPIDRIVWRALRSFAGILLPIGFVVSSVRRRQFSLRRLLMVPAVLLLVMMAWQAQLNMAHGRWISEWFVGLVTAFSFFALVHLVIRGRWKQIGICVVVSLVAGTVLMKGAESVVGIQNPGMTGYWTAWNWLSAVIAFAFQLSLPAAAFLGFLSANADRFRKWTGTSKSSRTLRNGTFRPAGDA